MRDLPLGSFSVLMPIYDREDIASTFEDAVNSCLQNTIVPDQIIIVVDGPIRDGFASKVKAFESNDRITAVWLEKNIGITGALNQGLAVAKTKYVFRADGDDINRLNRFEVQLKLLSQGFGLVGGAICERDREGSILAVKRVPTDHESILRYGLRRCPFNHMTVAFDLSDVRKVGGYPDTISNVGLGEDWALWMLLLKSGCKATNSDEILVDASADIEMYRRRGGVDKIESEFRMQRFLVEHSQKKIWLAALDFMAKAAFFLIPSTIRGIIYINVLRDKS